jgi:hypothetical protein
VRPCKHLTRTQKMVHMRMCLCFFVWGGGWGWGGSPLYRSGSFRGPSPGPGLKSGRTRGKVSSAPALRPARSTSGTSAPTEPSTVARLLSVMHVWAPIPSHPIPSSSSSSPLLPPPLSPTLFCVHGGMVAGAQWLAAHPLQWWLLVHCLGCPSPCAQTCPLMLPSSGRGAGC